MSFEDYGKYPSEIKDLKVEPLTLEMIEKTLADVRRQGMRVRLDTVSVREYNEKLEKLDKRFGKKSRKGR